MSWDVLIQDLPDVASVTGIPDDFHPRSIGSRVELIRRIQDVVPIVDFSDPAWGPLDADDFSIEFNMGKDEDVHSIVCHVRGISGGGACIVEIVKHLGLKALDTGTGEFLDFSNPDLGFDEWKKFRDKCIRSIR